MSNMNAFRVIIAGCRTFNNYNKLKMAMDRLLINKHSVTIVSGAARGADRLGEKYAKERNIPVDLFPAEWDRFGKRAGYLRNEQTADNADALVAFWDGQSPGTRHMIKTAYDRGLEVRVVRF